MLCENLKPQISGNIGRLPRKERKEKERKLMSPSLTGLIHPNDLTLVYTFLGTITMYINFGIENGGRVYIFTAL